MMPWTLAWLQDQDALTRKFRTHVLVLELLAAVCLVPSGHKKVLEAFDNFQRQMSEATRFQTLMHLLRTERRRVGVMVAAMAFINVVVHCVPDMNYQVCDCRSVWCIIVRLVLLAVINEH